MRLLPSFCKTPTSPQRIVATSAGINQIASIVSPRKNHDGNYGHDNAHDLDLVEPFFQKEQSP